MRKLSTTSHIQTTISIVKAEGHHCCSQAVSCFLMVLSFSSFLYWRIVILSFLCLLLFVHCVFLSFHYFYQFFIDLFIFPYFRLCSFMSSIVLCPTLWLITWVSRKQMWEYAMFWGEFMSKSIFPGEQICCMAFFVPCHVPEIYCSRKNGLRTIVNSSCINHIYIYIYIYMFFPRARFFSAEGASGRMFIVSSTLILMVFRGWWGNIPNGLFAISGFSGGDPRRLYGGV